MRQLSLSPGSGQENILLPLCNNQHITANQSANCPVSLSSVTTLTLVDFSHWTNVQRGALLGGVVGGVAGAVAMTVAAGGPFVGIIMLGSLYYGGR